MTTTPKLVALLDDVGRLTKCPPTHQLQDATVKLLAIVKEMHDGLIYYAQIGGEISGKAKWKLSVCENIAGGEV